MSAIDVIVTSIPQGLIIENKSKLVFTLIAMPWNVIHLRTPIPIDAIFLLPTQTPVCPDNLLATIPKHPNKSMIKNSILNMKSKLKQ